MSRSAWLVLVLFAACAASPPPGPMYAPPEPESEAIVWYTSKVTGQLESAWIRGGADGRHTVIATRRGVVVAGGTYLRGVSPSDDLPRSCREVGGVETFSTQAYFVPLDGRIGSTSFSQIPFKGWQDRTSEWSDELTPVGSAGHHLLLRRSGSYYACGAREVGFDQTWLFEDGATPDRRPTFEVVDATRYGPSTAALEALVSEACRGTFVFAPSGNAAARGISKRGEHVLQRSALSPEAASPHARCNEELAAKLAAHPPVEAWATTPMIERALRERAADGPVGYGPVSLEGAARDRALELFNRNDAGPWPAMRPLDEVRASLKQAALLLERHEVDDAIAIYDRLLAAEPSLSRALSGRAYAKLQAGDLLGAKSDFTASLALDPRRKFHGEVERELAEIEGRLGNADAAHTHLLRAYALLRDDGLKKRIIEIELPRERPVSLLVADAPVELTTKVLPVGMPAISQDGKYFVLSHEERGWGGRGIEIVRLSDGRQVFSEIVFTGDDHKREGETPSDVYVAGLRKRAERVRAELAKHQWRPLGEREPKPSWSVEIYGRAAGGLTFMYFAGHKVPGQLDQPVSFERTMDAVKAGRCQPGISTAGLWMLPDRGVMVIRTRHDSSVIRCPTPPGKTFVWPIPTASDPGGWRLRGR